MTGALGYCSIEVRKFGDLPLRAGAVRTTPPLDLFAKRRRWTHKCAGGSERHDAAVSGAPTGRLATYLRAGVARRYGGRDGRCGGGRRDNGVLVEDARERGLQDAVLVGASPDDGACADRFLRAREISGRGHTNGAEIHRPDCSVEFRDRHVQPDEAGVIGRLDAGVGLDLEIAAVAGEVDEEKGAFEGLRRTLRRA